MRILESSEDYLEAMLMMQEKHGFIRSIDIAAELGVTKPSVSYATKRLRENGYITMDKDGLITLTPAGMEIASRVYDRHKTLTHFFMHLGVDEKTAREVTSRCGFGGGCINDVLIHLATSNMGFGGFGESGMGSYHGIDGFRTFSHYKSIVDKKTWIDLPMRYQKYRKVYEKMVRMFMR